jgi:hypothetical protein
MSDDLILKIKFQSNKNENRKTSSHTGRSRIRKAGTFLLEISIYLCHYKILNQFFEALLIQRLGRKFRQISLSRR